MMDIDARKRVIDRYYDGLDEHLPDTDLMMSAFTDDVKFRYPGEPLHEKEAVPEYFTHRRQPAETTHGVVRRIHAETTTVCEVDASEVYREGGPFEPGPFRIGGLNVFDFDEETGLVSRNAVYVQARPDDD